MAEKITFTINGKLITVEVDPEMLNWTPAKSAEVAQKPSGNP